MGDVVHIEHKTEIARFDSKQVWRGFGGFVVPTVREIAEGKITWSQFLEDLRCRLRYLCRSQMGTAKGGPEVGAHDCADELFDWRVFIH